MLSALPQNYHNEQRLPLNSPLSLTVICMLHCQTNLEYCLGVDTFHISQGRRVDDASTFACNGTAWQGFGILSRKYNYQPKGPPQWVLFVAFPTVLLCPFVVWSDDCKAASLANPAASRYVCHVYPNWPAAAVPPELLAKYVVAFAPDGLIVKSCTCRA